VDDTFKRLIISVAGFTCAMWIISFLMMAIGVAHSKNPSWQIVINLRWIFSLLVGGGVGLFTLMNFSEYLDARAKRIKEEKAAAIFKQQKEIAQDLVDRLRSDIEDDLEKIRDQIDRLESNEKNILQIIKCLQEQKTKSPEDLAKAAASQFM
jgi:hypothetical protein